MQTKEIQGQDHNSATGISTKSKVSVDARIRRKTPAENQLVLKARAGTTGTPRLFFADVGVVNEVCVFALFLSSRPVGATNDVKRREARAHTREHRTSERIKRKSAEPRRDTFFTTVVITSRSRGLRARVGMRSRGIARNSCRATRGKTARRRFPRVGGSTDSLPRGTC